MALSFLRTNIIKRAAYPAISITPKRKAGYVVLIPEIGEDVSDQKMLLGPNGLPEFNDITIEKCIAVIGTQALEFESNIKSIESKADQCKNFFTDILEPLERFENPLELTWGMSKTLYLGNNSLMPTETYIKINERAHQARTTKFYSLPIYRALKKEKERCKVLDEEKQRLLDKYLLEGKLNGLDVSGTDVVILSEVLHKLHSERKIFRDKVNQATKIFSHNIENREIVKDFPESLLKSMAVNSSDVGRPPWKVTLQPHIYDLFMKYCPSRSLRWNTYQAHIGRCGNYSTRGLETSLHLEEIRDLRQRQAKILGFDSFADMSMETKMAGSVENVKSMLNFLLEKARPAQDRELKSLQEYAKDNGYNEDLDYCDIPYWQTKQQNSLYNFDEEKIREYFPLPKVLKNLFNLCSNLFKIDIVERPHVSAWHKDVKFYDIFDSSSNSPVAGFYFDPYARDDIKIRVHDNVGWHITISNKCTSTGSIPLSALIFNFQVPMYGKQSLLSFEEVEVLFEKFGHALRHLLTKVNHPEVAGNNNIEWDAAEVCGKVLANWLYDPDTVRSISAHYSSEEPLPDEIINNLQNVRGHMAGYKLCRELYLSTLDLELHSSKEFWRDISRRLWPIYHALPYDKNNSHPCHFTKIISEQWGAAYYCNIWSHIIAADVYSAFEEAKHNETCGVSDVGTRYLNTFLSLGGACHPSEVFRRFQGRDPSVNALLNNLKLNDNTVAETE